VLIACLENVASMSKLLEHERSEDSQKNVGSLAISMLEEIIASAERCSPTDSKRGSMIRSEIANDSKYAISRISVCTHQVPQSYPEDIASAFQASQLIGDSISLAAPTSLHSSGDDKCIQFMYNYSCLVLSNRTNMAIKAMASTSATSDMSTSKKLIRTCDLLRLKNSFSTSTIKVYEKLPNLPLLIPTRSPTRNVAVTLTGSSDPVSVLLSHSMRRVRKADSSDGLVLVVTIKLFNITTVPIRNGVHLKLRISQESFSGKRMMLYDGSTSCVATSVYNHEIKAGDFVAWEVTLNGEVASTNLSLQPFVTF